MVGLGFFDSFPVVAIEFQSLHLEGVETRTATSADDFRSESSRETSEEIVFENVIGPAELSRQG